MNLKELITALKKEKNRKTRIVANGFANPHSYRGYYEQVAFEPAENVTVESMLQAAKKALGSTYSGWKGGEFTMHEFTTVNLSFRGNVGEEIGTLSLKAILADEVNPKAKSAKQFVYTMQYSLNGSVWHIRVLAGSLREAQVNAAKSCFMTPNKFKMFLKETPLHNTFGIERVG